MPISDKEDKEMLASLVEWYLATHKEVDIKVFLEEKIDSWDVNPGLIREIANILRREGKYEITEGGIGSELTFVIRPISIPVKTWAELHPVKDKWRTGFITFFFSVVASIIVFLLLPQNKAPDNSQQIQRLNHLSDSLNILQKNFADSIAKLRADLPK